MGEPRGADPALGIATDMAAEAHRGKVELRQRKPLGTQSEREPGPEE